MEPAAAASAKRFLLAKLEEQAIRDGVPLSDLEKEMFLFSEGTASNKMQALAEEFDSTCDDAEYERKISAGGLAFLPAKCCRRYSPRCWRISGTCARDGRRTGGRPPRLSGRV